MSEPGPGRKKPLIVMPESSPDQGDNWGDNYWWMYWWHENEGGEMVMIRPHWDANSNSTR